MLWRPDPSRCRHPLAVHHPQQPLLRRLDVALKLRPLRPRPAGRGSGGTGSTELQRRVAAHTSSSSSKLPLEGPQLGRTALLVALHETDWRINFMRLGVLQFHPACRTGTGAGWYVTACAPHRCKESLAPGPSAST